MNMGSGRRLHSDGPVFCGPQGAGFAKFIELKTLKASTRKANAARSRIRARFPKDRSASKNRGPRNVLRPEFPISPAAGRVNCLIWPGLNQYTPSPRRVTAPMLRVPEKSAVVGLVVPAVR